MKENRHLGKIAVLVGAPAEGTTKTAEGLGANRAEVSI
jgi:crotonyl-CoA carboxylase/reductase